MPCSVFWGFCVSLTPDGGRRTARGKPPHAGLNADTKHVQEPRRHPARPVVIAGRTRPLLLRPARRPRSRPLSLQFLIRCTHVTSVSEIRLFLYEEQADWSSGPAPGQQQQQQQRPTGGHVDALGGMGAMAQQLPPQQQPPQQQQQQQQPNGPPPPGPPPGAGGPPGSRAMSLEDVERQMMQGNQQQQQQVSRPPHKR
jgi:hypothetical protein